VQTHKVCILASYSCFTVVEVSTSESAVLLKNNKLTYFTYLQRLEILLIFVCDRVLN